MCSTCPSTCPPGAPRTHTQAESPAVSVSACADVDPAGQFALAVNGTDWSESVGGGADWVGAAVARTARSAQVSATAGSSRWPNPVSAATIATTATSRPAPSTTAVFFAPALASIGSSGPTLVSGGGRASSSGAHRRRDRDRLRVLVVVGLRQPELPRVLGGRTAGRRPDSRSSSIWSSGSVHAVALRMIITVTAPRVR